MSHSLPAISRNTNTTSQTRVNKHLDRSWNISCEYQNLLSCRWAIGKSLYPLGCFFLTTSWHFAWQATFHYISAMFDVIQQNLIIRTTDIIVPTCDINLTSIWSDLIWQWSKMCFCYEMLLLLQTACNDDMVWTCDFIFSAYGVHRDKESKGSFPVWKPKVWKYSKYHCLYK